MSGPGLKRLRSSSKAESIRQLNRQGQRAAAQQVAAQRPPPLPKVMVPADSAALLRSGLQVAVRMLHSDAKARHAKATGKARERLYGELLGYDAVLEVLKKVVLAG